jgi:hypothetical protein
MEPEEIPDEDRLYYRVHRSQLRGERIHANVFRERDGAMSVDWEAYSTPHETRARGRQSADTYGVLAFVTGSIRGIRVPPLSVVHEPLASNRAHAGVHGINASKTMARLKLFKLVPGWEISPDARIQS